MTDPSPASGFAAALLAALLGRGMRESPSGPPVNVYQFSRTTRMTSPKASVTIAR